MLLFVVPQFEPLAVQLGLLLIYIVIVQITLYLTTVFSILVTKSGMPGTLFPMIGVSAYAVILDGLLYK